MPYLFLLVLIFPVLSQANNHILIPLVSFHLDQKTLPGYGLGYQYRYNDSFEFDIGMIQSNDLEVVQAQQTTFGHYTSIFVGTNFMKTYNDDLTIKAGTGLTYFLSSNNQQLVTNNQVSPYIKISAEYKLNLHLHLEVGQLSTFSKGDIGNNHSIFIGLAWSFGTTNISSLEQKQLGAVNTRVVDKVIENNIITPDRTSLSLNKATKLWIVQLAAFKNIDRANNMLFSLQKVFDKKGADIRLTIVKTKNLHKLVTSTGFDNKEDAKVIAKNIDELFGIKSFVTTSSPTNTFND